MKDKTMPSAVDHLKKVTLEIQAGSRMGKLEFICGAASDGFCPFEYELLHKTPGDQLHLSVPPEKAVRTFAHLYKPLQKAVGIGNPAETIDLRVSVISISDPEPREIIQALAQAADQNGCGGDCGCGCGGC
jgi:bacterioferritin-associated ferredoxin